MSDPNSFIAIEVFEGQDAFDQQNAQQEVVDLLALINSGASEGNYEWTTWEAPGAR